MNKRRVVIGIIAGIIAFAGVLVIRPVSKASPSQIAAANSTLQTSYTAQHRIARTTNGPNGNRVFAVFNTGSALSLYYSDDADAASPTWSSLSLNAASTYANADLVWDETNNVIYVCYARRAGSNSANSDVLYRRVSSLGGTPSLGAQQIALNGASGGTIYNLCNIEIAGDSGTDKVIVFGNAELGGITGTASRVVLTAGTINSDAPTWTSPYTVKSWTSAANSGTFGVTRVNTNKLVLFYHNDVDFMATRHDDNSAINAASGWDALDGTDDSATSISTDEASNLATGAVIGSWNTDSVWFGWLDSANDINTRYWNGSSLDTELVPLNGNSATIGPALTTDGTTLYMLYRNQTATTELIVDKRPFTDGTTAWSANTSVLYAHASELIAYPSVAKKLYQGKIDALVTTATSTVVMHASTYRISGNIYQESASPPYEGTTPWSGCDNATLNVAVSIAGGTKVNTWCDAASGAFSFALTQPAASDSDITVFLDTGGGAKAALFTHNADTITDITGLALFVNRIVIRSESSSSVTNADINSYDQSNDADIPIASDGTHVTADSGTKITVNTGDTYAPGGNVTSPKLHLKGTYTGNTETLTLTGAGSSATCDSELTSIAVLCLDSGTFTAPANVVLGGADSTTQSLVGSMTFNNLSASTAANSAGRTIRYTAGTTTTVGGTWTMTGFSGKLLTLESSSSSAWTINPTAASVDFVNVSYSTNTGGSFCATNSNSGGNNTGWDISAGASCVGNSAPAEPSLDSPADTAASVSTTPALETTAVDPDSDYLRYKIILCEDSGLTVNCQTFDQTISQTGWSGQNTESGSAYTSGTQAAYTLQSALDYETTYYWASYAIDPAGSNTWGSTQSSPYSFTTASEPAPGNETFSLEGINFEGVSFN